MRVRPTTTFTSFVRPSLLKSCSSMYSEIFNNYSTTLLPYIYTACDITRSTFDTFFKRLPTRRALNI